MKVYETLFKAHREQPLTEVFAHFYAINGDYDEPFKIVARATVDGIDAWHFHQERFRAKYSNTSVPKLKNYLQYTFKRLMELEQNEPGRYFIFSEDGDWVCFNTGLQNAYGADLVAVFNRYKARPGAEFRVVPDYVFKGCNAPSDSSYRARFGMNVPDLAWYSTDSRDYVFDTSYALERDVFDHLFDRAKERAGLPNVSDEVVRNYLRGAIENIIPKIRRNYKVAIPVYYVEERRMQLLLPFQSANASDVSCFLIVSIGVQNSPLIGIQF
ncbi:DUF3825 domain-containing protein [Rhizobium mulingense]|uniref:DUF3825 domain-containing protein n=1 Tax=Rhizobium mulingense TaxID=3031128 RepID=UPI002B497B7E|nr:DUF3825 domain-containing protein [Rhizobium sp. MJ21]MEB3047370.1 DUF3825 domain-containing protein [Rhizobium sp. MJ21]